MPVIREQSYALHLKGGGSSFNPGDATTHYTGAWLGNFSVGSTLHKVYIPRAGILRIADFAIYFVTAGTAESWSIYLRLNDTTDHLIAAVATADNIRRWFNAGMNIPVAVGDHFQIKTTTPTWVTNPLGGRAWGNVIIDY